MTHFKIVRFYFDAARRTLTTVPSLSAAQLHCNDPETSSRTCTSRAGKDRTRRLGHWFDGYEEV